MQRRPKIGITTRLEMPTSRFYLGRDYSEAIAAAGGLPLHIGLIPDRDLIEETVAGLDGILLPGSNTDVDPLIYGEEPQPELGTVIPEKDQTDIMVIEAAERRGLPIFGICFGMQILNVSRGGTLIQDIRTEVSNPIKHEQGMPTDRLSHSIRIDGSRILTKLDAYKVEIRVNTSHHQAVKSVGRDLKAVAWSTDGIIECIEDTRDDKWIIGVQWHPELTTKNDRFSLNLFESFVAECRSRFDV